MKNLTLSYPPMPAGADKNVIKPSKSFKNRVYIAVSAIILFIICYLLLFLGSLAIAIAFGYIGVAFIVLHPAFITLVVGVALILSGLMLVYFVIKFIFKRTRVDYSDMIEITADQHPALFDFISKITIEAQAPRPKRIYLSADVNAGVFYSSSFWSMFLPVKKNLKIGLGLINSVNLSEFKAVMAHEFGHFSQRSMKVGSYVYNFNKVLYNMLYDTEDYSNLISRFARVHGVFSMAASLNIKLIQGMQYILRKIYIVVNKAHLALSREMEFQADAVAAYVSGSNHIISSLKRIDIGQACYENLINYSRANLKQNKRADNLYPQHLEMIRHFANYHKIEIDAAALPIISDGWNLPESSEIVIKNQWSSHPTNNEREVHANRINLTTTTVNEPAWVLFEDPLLIQTQLTDHLYEIVNTDKNAERVTIEAFKQDFYSKITENSFDPQYNNYFDDRLITAFNIDDALANQDYIRDQTFEGLLNAENSNLPAKARRLQGDIDIFDSLIWLIKSKLLISAALNITPTIFITFRHCLNRNMKLCKKRIEELDKNLFLFFYMRSTDTQREMLIAQYNNLFDYQQEAVADYEMYNNIMRALAPVYNKMTVEQIHDTLAEVYKQERYVKKRINETITDETSRKYFNEVQIKILEDYLAVKHTYYLEPRYDNQALQNFNEAMEVYVLGIAKRNFEIKKDLLNFQLQFVN
ncbi:M48 family metallopeptidase [Mucilaginibacter sp. NFR10]|uniref:M48 family metallopeptidase n=1 Tax=Mucilaginibacter sp. NFR10 TaxID=1566292 RepID=UPI0008719633|nr:M48 family metallopeptidase [Mucilaginibacter sp. NFR10]SCW37407.1 Zn-dependent protease with chaperone function [Mucilaginibacter sp. NFR10]